MVSDMEHLLLQQEMLNDIYLEYTNPKKIIIKICDGSIYFIGWNVGKNKR